MTEKHEVIELEISEEDILYRIVDEDDVEIGFAIMEDGVEVEYYYEDEAQNDDAPAAQAEASALSAGENADEEVIELEISEEDILYRIVDEDDVEIGFAIMEDGVEVEYFYDGSSADDYREAESTAQVPSPAKTTAQQAVAQPAPKPEAEAPKERGYFYKMASIAGFHGNKARKKAEVQVEKVRGVAEKQVDKATQAVEKGGKKLQEKRQESDLGITRENLAETTADLNVIAKEGAETAKELKAAYDDIMDSFGMFVPKKIKRKLP